MSNWIEHAAARPRADRPRRRRHRTPIRLAAAGAVVLAVAATASPAAAQDDAMQLISGSGDASNVGTDSGASADGSAYVFETAESSAPRFRPRFRGPRRSTRPRNVPGIGDTDGLNDIYRAQGGKITLLTGNNPAASGGADVYLDATSADDSRVIFETSENVPGTGDTDDLVDVYEAEGGRINLLSGSNPAGSGGKDVLFEDASADGRSVFFTTSENVPVIGDTDDLVDVYRATAGGFLDLMTNSNPAASGGKDARFDGLSDDGGKVFFQTSENVAATADTDGLVDVYRGNGPLTAFTLISSNNPAATGGKDAYFIGALQGGDVVYSVTEENVPNTGDTDDLVDGYVRIATPSFNAVARETGSNPAAAGGKDAFLERVGPDGTLVFTTTEDVPGTGDTDGLGDIYLIKGGQTSLLTGSNPASAGGATALFYDAGVTSDLSSVYFLTTEDIPNSGDNDGLDDFYRADANGIALVTGSNPAASGGKNVGVTSGPRHNVSADGKRFFFQSEEDIPGTGDTDGLPDVFRAQDGKITLLSGSNPAGSGGSGAGYTDAASDGSRVFFTTPERIPGTGDNDDGRDVYTFGPLPPTSGGTTGGDGTATTTGDGGATVTGGDGAQDASGSTTPTADHDPAVVSRLRVRPARLVAATSGASITRLTRKPGASVTYALSQDATIRFAVQRRGRRRAPLAGSFAHSGHAGTNAFRFTGRLRNRPLRPGRYTLVATATDGAGNTSKPVTARFTVVKKRQRST